MDTFTLISDFQPAGDQPQAIEALVEGLNSSVKHQTLLGVTGSGKTYTMASVIANEFSEATGDLYTSALIEIGLALFLVTIVVNAFAQLLVWSVTKGQPARGNA